MDVVESRLQRAFEDAMGQLRYWRDRPDTFWQSWKGDGRRKVVGRWEKEVGYRKSKLDEYRNRRVK